MEVDPPSSLCQFPFELLLMIVALLDPSDRNTLCCTSTRLNAVCRRYRRRRLLAILPSAPANPYQWRCCVVVYAVDSSALQRWCEMSSAENLESVSWVFNCVIRQPPMNALPMHFICALPVTLQRLNLCANGAQPGDCLIRSLCASLPNALSLIALELYGFGAPDVCAVVNALSVRARRPVNCPLREFRVHLTQQSSLSWALEPDGTVALDTSGLACVEQFKLLTHDVALPNELAFVSSLANQALGANVARVQTFEYTGPPLPSAESWSSMVLRSAETLHELIVPPFCADVSPTVAEMAVDKASCLQQLSVHWQSARLDMMLRNKPALRVLSHYGTVADTDGALLGEQMARLSTLQHVTIFGPTGPCLPHILATQAHWPAVKSVNIHGLDPSINDALLRILPIGDFELRISL